MNAKIAGWSVLITCEHGGNSVPLEFAALFQGAETLLASHRGYDPGAIELAQDLANALHAPLFTATISRLLVDLNRSLGHPALYSEITRTLPNLQRQEIRDRYYLPYRRQVEQHIATQRNLGQRIVHIAAHSFAPILAGQERRADVGLLYDPKRAGEARFARHWQQQLRDRSPSLRVRRNYPYLGTADGLPMALRKCHSAENYLGFELEFNQCWKLGDAGAWTDFRTVLTSSVCAMVTSLADCV
jgi:predicted N-formylglutamate amidohydrolase